MTKAPLVTVQGFCDDEPLRRVDTKTWRQGHSIGCERRGGKAIRYWQPDKDRYYPTKFARGSDLRAEVWDFCHTCRFYQSPEVKQT